MTTTFIPGQLVPASILNQALAERAALVDLAAGQGSALVGFGGRTIADRLGDFKSVADFGIVPDGTTNWEGVGGTPWTNMLAYALSNGVYWPKGYYATGINLDSSYSGIRFHFEDGAVIGGVFHLISDPSPTTAALSSISRTANVVTVVTATNHGYSTGQRCRIYNVYVTGSGSVDFNTDDVTITVTNATTFTYAQTGPNESGTVTGAGVAQRPIKKVTVTGRLTTTDRLGSINAKDCYIERAWVKSDPTQHSAYPGTTCRGAHLYVGTDDLTIGELIIDDASGANTDAALAVDGNAWNPGTLKIGYCWVKDSDYHGVYLTGGRHRIGELRIDAFARGSYGGTLQDSNGSAQSAELKAFWPNRCWDTEIGVLRTNQNPAGSRGQETCQVVIDETGSNYFGTDWQGIRIGAWYAKNVRRVGIRIGETATYDSLRCNVSIGLMEVSLDPAGLSASQFAVRCNGASLGSKVSIDTLRFLNVGANAALYTEISADVSIRRLEVYKHTDRVLQARGRVNISDLYAYNSGIASANPMVNFANAAVKGSNISNMHLDSAGAVSTRAFQADTGCNSWDIGKITTNGYRETNGTIWLDGITGWRINALALVGPDATGVGIGFNGSVGDGYLGPGRVEGFAKGFSKGSASFTRIVSVGLNGNGCTTPTDLVNGSATMLGCNGVTL